MRFLTSLLVAFVLAIAVVSPAMADDPSPRTSYVFLDHSGPVHPYDGVDLNLGLLDELGRPLVLPAEGKLFLWAVADGEETPSEALRLVPRSIAADIAVHPLAGHPGVMIADAAAFQRGRNFKVSFAASGRYEVRALYMPSAADFQELDPALYASLAFTGSGAKGRTVEVGPTPIRDVGLIICSTSVNGVALGHATIQPPGKQTVQSMTVPIHEDGETLTALTLRLLRANGEPVGAGVPVYVTTSAPGTRIAGDNPHKTDANGEVRLRLSGDAGANGFLGLRLDPKDGAMLLPLARYAYHPQRVRLDIGADHMDVDGRDIRLDTPALVKDGRTYVPYRAIGEILGAEITYNQTIRTITTVYDDRTITMTLGYDHYAINEHIYPMDARPFITPTNRTMVPLRFIAKATGYKVEAVTDARGLVKTVLFTRS